MERSTHPARLDGADGGTARSGGSGAPHGLLAALGVALAVLVAAGLVFSNDRETKLKRAAEIDLQSIALFKVEQIKSWRNERLGDAYVITESPFLAQGIGRFLENSDPLTEKDLRQRFSSLKIHYRYADVLLVSPEGRVLLSLSGQEAVTGKLPEILKRAAHSRAPVFTDIHTDADGDEPHISVIAPVFRHGEPGHEFLGALAIKMAAAEFLYPLLQTWPTHSTTAETLLVQRDGDDALFLNALRHKPDAALKLRIPLSRTDNPAAMAASGKRGLVRGTDYRGREVLAYLTEVPGTDWIMVSKMDADEVYAEWRHQAKLIVALFACLLAGMCGTAILLWTRAQKSSLQLRLEAETRLRESLEFQSVTLSSIADGVVATDAGGLITFYNPAAGGMLGASGGSVLGKAFDEAVRIIHELSQKPVKSPLEQALKGRVAPEMSEGVSLLSSDGAATPVSVSASPIRDERGMTAGAALVIRDRSAEREARAASLALAESERRYRELVENAQSIILKVDNEGRVTFFNEFAQRFFGYADHEIIGRHVLGTIVPERGSTEEDTAAVVRDALARPEHYRLLENENMRRDNSRVFVRWNNTPLLDEKGQPAGILCVGTDITDRRRAELELLKRWQIMEQTPASIVITDHRGTIEYVNPFFSRLTGYGASEAIGQNPRLLKSGLQDDVLYKDLWDTISSGAVWRGDLCNRKKDGTLYWEHASISPVKDEAGRITHYVAVKEDVTAKKELEELKEDMERIARHDLKTPLSGIMGIPQILLMDDNLTQEQRQYLEILKDSGERMLSMINMSLELFRMERGTYMLCPANVDIARMARRAAGDLGQAAAKRNVGVNLLLEGRDAGPDDGFYARGEENLCRSLFSNLLKNAVEASPPGSRVSVDMRLGHDGARHVAIRNAGEVPPEVRERFFEKYATSGKPGGTGLGAYSARLMARTMGGDVTLDHAEPGFTTVTVTLPGPAPA